MWSVNKDIPLDHPVLEQSKRSLTLFNTNYPNGVLRGPLSNALTVYKAIYLLFSRLNDTVFTPTIPR
jgi:hypothetical protein